MINWHALVQPPLSSLFFISYRSIDNHLAEALESALVKSGQRVWRDRRNIYTSDDWKSEIDRALSASNDIVVLLTPEAAASQQVLYELETGAMLLGKRVHCFSTFDIRTAPQLYRIVGHLNLERLPAELSVVQDQNHSVLAQHVVGRLLAPEAKPDPLDLRDFERFACRTVFPRFHTIWHQGRFDRDLLGRYLSYASQLFSSQQRCNAAVALNAAILAMHCGHWPDATACFEESVRLEGAGMSRYYFALALMRRIRPRHMSAQAIDRAVQLITEAWQAHQSALIALTLVLLLWDTGRGRGPKLATLFSEASMALAQTESWRDEIDRFRILLPVHDEIDLPVPMSAFRRYLLQLGELG